MRVHRRLAVALGAAVLVLAGLLVPSAAQAAPGQRLDLRLLVIGGAQGDPTTDAWTTELTRQGIPFDVVRRGADNDAALPALVDPSDATHGRYNGVVLGTHASLLGNLDAVYAYERAFDVRQISGYEFPNPSVGLTYTGDNVAGPFTAQLTQAGKGAFSYLAGPVPLDEGSSAYDSYDAAADYTDFKAEAWAGEPLSTNFVPYVLTPTEVRGQAVKGRIIGGFFTNTKTDPAIDPKAGVKEVVLTFNYNPHMTQWRLLAPGLIRWVTRGVHLGYNRNYLSNHVDDIFMDNTLWSVELHCTPANPDPHCPDGKGDDPNGPRIRMTAADVDKVIAWQKAHGLRLDLAFNASEAVSGDPLTSALLANKASFGWINHTWAHPFLGCKTHVVADDPTSGCALWPSVTEIKAEISQNVTWATKNKLPNFDAKTLVTGEHSGLDNPNMPQALAETGITSIAADNSRQAVQRLVGPALTVPRHPSSIYYNVSTWAELVDEYNTIYLTPEAGGRCVATAVTTCRTVPATKEEIVQSETGIMLRHLLSNDPRPGYSHQSNLAAEQVLLDLLGNVINTYKSYFSQNSPIVTPTQGAAAVELARQAEWRAAVAGAKVQASIKDGVVIVTVAEGMQVPLTLPSGSAVLTTSTVRKTTTTTSEPYGQAYAGAQSAWTSVKKAAPLTVQVG